MRDAFGRIGGLSPEFLPIVGSDETERYRNKAQFPVKEDTDGRLYAGFYARRSHRAVKCADCLLLPREFTEIAERITEYCTESGVRAYDELTGEGELRHIFIRRGAHSGEMMAAAVVTSEEHKELFTELAEKLSEEYPKLRSFMLNINPERGNVILGRQSVRLFGSDCITDTMCGNKVTVSLDSFYQINTFQAERVYAQAAEFAELTGKETLLDLYCGAGTVGLSMARRAGKLIGVEAVPQAIENARENAAANGIGNAEFICGDAGKASRLLFERGEKPDVIIADPARKGCTPDTLEYMAKMSPRRIVMISCDPSTAARDCAVLGRLGYSAVRVRAFDLFPRTAHVESVTELVSENSK